MDNFTATVNIKCHVTGADSLKPRKELSQRFDKYNLKTQAMDEEDWWMRRFFAYMILKYGLDFEDWVAVEDESEWWWDGPPGDDIPGGYPGGE